MPLLQNAKKALRSSRRKAVFNSRVRSILKTTTDRMKKDPTKSNLSSAFSSIDKAVKKNLIHKNKASRLKAQLSKLVSANSAPEAKKPATKTAKKKVAKKSVKKTTKKTTKKALKPAKKDTKKTTKKTVKKTTKKITKAKSSSKTKATTGKK